MFFLWVNKKEWVLNWNATLFIPDWQSLSYGVLIMYFNELLELIGEKTKNFGALFLHIYQCKI
jgi:hypothetical protein